MAEKTFRQTIFPTMRYHDARAAIAWLERAFGAVRNVEYDAPDGTVAHAQVSVAGGAVMLGESRDDEYEKRTPAQTGGVTAAIYVVLPDESAVRALYERAVAAGAQIVRAPYATDYGSVEFGALDCGGHPWSFGTYDPSAEYAST